MLPKEYELDEGVVGVEVVEVHDGFHEIVVSEYSLENDATGFTGKTVDGWVNDERGGGHGDGCRLGGLDGWGEVGWVSSFIFFEDGSCVREVTFRFPSIFGRRETFPGYQILTTSGGPTMG